MMRCGTRRLFDGTAIRSQSVVLVAVFLIACGGSGTSAPSTSVTTIPTPASTPSAATSAPAPSVTTGAVIRASVNPVHTVNGKGTTTITWDTGDGSLGQVFVSEQGGPDRLFAAGSSGSEAAAWIAVNEKFEFRLFAGDEHRTLLATVTVTGT
ncbi:MAG: hypothetical protein ACYDAR_06485 [Thermomicrobiales bacterium]